MADVTLRAGWSTGPRNISAEFRRAQRREPTARETDALVRLARRNAGVFAFEGKRSPNRNDQRDFETAQRLATFFVAHARGPDGGDPTTGKLGGPETMALIHGATSSVPGPHSAFGSIAHAVTSTASGIGSSVANVVRHPSLKTALAVAAQTNVAWVGNEVARKAVGSKTFYAIAPANIRAPLKAIMGLGSGSVPANKDELAVAALSAFGKADALRAPDLAAARAAIPGGIENRVGFDLATGALSGSSPANAEKLHFLRGLLRTDAQRAAFDAAVALHEKTHPAEAASHAEALKASSPNAARIFAQSVTAGTLAARTPPHIRERASRTARAGVRARSLSPRARSWVSDAIRKKAAHALTRETRGLDPGGRTYTVDPNDSAWRIAQNLTGDGNAHWRELIAANSPPKLIKDSADPVALPRALRFGEYVRATFNFASLKAGEKLAVPSTWKLATGAPPAPAPIVSPVVRASVPVTTPTAAVKSPQGPSAVHDVTPAAGETWEISFSLSRPVTSAEADTVRTKFTAAMVKEGDKAIAYVLAGQSGKLAVLYGNPAVIHVGMSAAVSVDPGTPMLTLTDAVRLAAAAPAPAPAPAPSAPAPSAAPRAPAASPNDDPNAIAQAKVILVAWEHTDGVAAAGLPDYGGRTEDTSPIWGARDGLELQAFCQWSNAHGAALPLVGDLTQEKLDALVAWSENKAKAAAPGGSMVVSAPTTAPAPTTAAPAAVAVTASGTVPETLIDSSEAFPTKTAGPGDTPIALLLILGLGIAGIAAASSKKKTPSAEAA